MPQNTNKGYAFNGMNNDFIKIFASFPNFAAPSAMDMKSLMETHRKNFQALTEAQQRTMLNMQAVAQKQTEIFSQFMEDNSAMAKEIMSEKTPEQKVAKQADIFKKVYERCVLSGQEINELLNKSNKEAGEIINKRVSATLNEIKDTVEKSQKAA